MIGVIEKHSTDIRTAVADAVRLVNRHPGQTCIRLRFRDEYAEDFVANSGILNGESFSFSAGFETYGGDVCDLAAIETETIRGGARGSC
jgi:hypothetical protein